MVLHVCKLMRDHASKLLPTKGMHEASSDGYGGVLRIAASCKGVRLRLVNEEHTRRWQTGARRQLGHKIVKIGRGCTVDLVGAVQRKHNPVRVPVGEQV